VGVASMAGSYRREVGGGGGGSTSGGGKAARERRRPCGARSPADGGRRWEQEEGLGEEAYCDSIAGGGGQL
jgi:hypothetical protein